MAALAAAHRQIPIPGRRRLRPPLLAGPPLPRRRRGAIITITIMAATPLSRLPKDRDGTLFTLHPAAHLSVRRIKISSSIVNI